MFFGDIKVTRTPFFPWYKWLLPILLYQMEMGVFAVKFHIYQGFVENKKLFFGYEPISLKDFVKDMSNLTI